MLQHDPFERFQVWWSQALTASPLAHKSAVCVSTINQDGFPEGRFVDLKQVSENSFIFCTSLCSAKGIDLQANSKCSMTIWWDHLGYQVRAVGHAHVISRELANRFWLERSKEAQITTLACQQSQVLDSQEALKNKVKEVSADHQGQTIMMPDSWGGYAIHALTIEFLEFSQDRLHVREKFVKQAGGWSSKLLQP